MTDTTELRESTASVVVVGNFNPLIFHPSWLKANELIGAEDATLATQQGIEIMHPQLFVVNLRAFRLEVTLDRFSVSAKEDPAISARDFAVKCFTLLSHTPVKQLGINRSVTFRAHRRVDWDALGDALAPKDHWVALLGEDWRDRKHGGLRTISMERALRPDGRAGKITVQVSVPPGINFDTQVDVNDHFELASIEKPDARAEVVVETLNSEWNTSMDRATKLVSGLRELCHADQ